MYFVKTKENNILKGSDVCSKLEELGEKMEGYKNSFEYIQDYIGVNCIKMWQVIYLFIPLDNYVVFYEIDHILLPTFFGKKVYIKRK